MAAARSPATCTGKRTRRLGRGVRARTGKRRASTLRALRHPACPACSYLRQLRTQHPSRFGRRAPSSPGQLPNRPVQGCDGRSTRDRRREHSGLNAAAWPTGNYVNRRGRAYLPLNSQTDSTRPLSPDPSRGVRSPPLRAPRNELRLRLCSTNRRKGEEESDMKSRISPSVVVLAILAAVSVAGAQDKPPISGDWNHHEFQVTSTTFSNGGTLPLSMVGSQCPYYAGGDNQSPELSWSGVPRGTRSLVVIGYDVTAAFTHWGMYNIPPKTSGLPDNAGVPAAPMGCRSPMTLATRTTTAPVHRRRTTPSATTMSSPCTPSISCCRSCRHLGTLLPAPKPCITR